MLTVQQRDCLIYIDAYQTREGGVSPTFEEIAIGLGLSSKSSVHRLVHALEERGFLRILSGRSRALEVLRLPGERAPVSNITIPQAGRAPALVAHACPAGKVS